MKIEIQSDVTYEILLIYNKFSHKFWLRTNGI